MTIAKPEYERRWLVESFRPKDAPDYTASVITQTYLRSFDNVVRRLRVEDSGFSLEYFYTTKFPTENWPLEAECEIDKVLYHVLGLETDLHLRAVTKTRYRIKDGDLTWELDLFSLLEHPGLMILELENPPENVVIPSWVTIIREITHERGWSNYELAGGKF